MLKTLAVLFIFILTYFGIVRERIHKTTVVLLGAGAVLVFGFVGPGDAWKVYFDYNTIGLLTGMMIIVGVIKKTGLLQYAAIKLTKASRGNFMLLFLFFSLATAFFSAFLDNVTTILLVAPITILITERVGRNPLPFLISEMICSNIGGTATLIGDPPNMLVGSAAGYSFTSFILNLTPIVVIVLFCSIVVLGFIYRANLRTGGQEAGFESMDERKAIVDPKLLRISLFVFGLTLVGFLLHDIIHIMPSMVALSGAVLLLLITRIHPDEALAEVEWSTLFFFIGLFVIVGAVEKAELISMAGRAITASVQNEVLLRILILWSSGIFSAFMGAVPIVTAFIPLVENLGRELSIPPERLAPLWWCLALGGSLGGIGTILGTAANMVVTGISERTRHRITYKSYLIVGFPIMIIALIISTGYVLLRYRAP
ncbi:hypothetical protein E3J38_09530 [candidate division TA06 bacterium]|uniref:Citrate transporter-like domain-containing protein n=1 Tax=candidate division TA06 bacterium TaxID=2250710 RepID=A0A523XEN2_UNCT6|nr:MAG: hypothetical protein E3J38_09530 [candidate division TA06 bacterium]